MFWTKEETNKRKQYELLEIITKLLLRNVMIKLRSFSKLVFLPCLWINVFWQGLYFSFAFLKIVKGLVYVLWEPGRQIYWVKLGDDGNSSFSSLEKIWFRNHCFCRVTKDKIPQRIFCYFVKDVMIGTKIPQKQINIKVNCSINKVVTLFGPVILNLKYLF